MIYDSVDLQCKQCGCRFYRSEDGKVKMNEHLDFHFRQNRRIKEKSKISGTCRSWYLSEDDWVKERDTDERTISTPTFFPESETPITSSTTIPEEILSNLPVETDIVEPCAICNEKFERFWDDDEGLWMIRNAVKVENKVCCVFDKCIYSFIDCCLCFSFLFFFHLNVYDTME